MSNPADHDRQRPEWHDVERSEREEKPTIKRRMSQQQMPPGRPRQGDTSASDQTRRYSRKPRVHTEDDREVALIQPARPKPRQPEGPPPTPPEESGLYVPWWGFIIVIVVVAAVTCGMWWAVLSSRGDAAQTQGPTPTPIFVVITSTPTLGTEEGAASGTEAAPATATPTSLPVATETPDVAANPVQVGSTIEINGTDGSGLAVRQGPGVNYTYFFVANDGDVFLVEDGPRDADGYTWWYISDPNNADRTGWAVEDWMTVTTP